MPLTASPRSSKAAARCEPMNPAHPVTTKRATREVVLERAPRDDGRAGPRERRPPRLPAGAPAAALPAAEQCTGHPIPRGPGGHRTIGWGAGGSPVGRTPGLMRLRRGADSVRGWAALLARGGSAPFLLVRFRPAEPVALVSPGCCQLRRRTGVVPCDTDENGRSRRCAGQKYRCKGPESWPRPFT